MSTVYCWRYLRNGQACLSFLALTCCGGGSFSGTVDGHTLKVADAIFAVASPPGAAQQLVVWLSSTSSRCADVAANHAVPEAIDMQLIFEKVATDGSSAAADTGAYNGVTFSTLLSTPSSTDAEHFVWGQLVPTDTRCQALYSGTTQDKVVISGGAATLSAIAAKKGGSAQGTYALKMGTQQDSIHGDFNAAYCDALATQISASSSEAVAKCD